MLMTIRLTLRHKCLERCYLERSHCFLCPLFQPQLALEGRVQTMVEQLNSTQNELETLQHTQVSQSQSGAADRVKRTVFPPVTRCHPPPPPPLPPAGERDQRQVSRGGRDEALPGARRACTTAGEGPACLTAGGRQEGGGERKVW